MSLRVVKKNQSEVIKVFPCGERFSAKKEWLGYLIGGYHGNCLGCHGNAGIWRDCREQWQEMESSCKVIRRLMSCLKRCLTWLERVKGIGMRQLGEREGTRRCNKCGFYFFILVPLSDTQTLDGHLSLFHPDSMCIMIFVMNTI